MNKNSWLAAGLAAAALAGSVVVMPASAQAAPTDGWQYQISARVNSTNFRSTDRIEFSPTAISGSSGMAGRYAYTGNKITPNAADKVTDRRGTGNLHTLYFPSRQDLPNLKLSGSVTDYNVAWDGSGNNGNYVQRAIDELIIPLDGSAVKVRVGSVGEVQFSATRVPTSTQYVEMSTSLYDAHDPGEPGALEVIGKNATVDGVASRIWDGSGSKWDSSVWTMMAKRTGNASSIRWKEDFYECDDFTRQYLGWMNVSVPLDGKERMYTAKHDGRDVTMKVSAKEMTRALFAR